MRVLFIVEAVTLAHVGRSIALAEGLHRYGLDVELAFAGTDKHWPTAFPQHRLNGIGAAAFARSLERGTPVLSVEKLDAMVDADLTLLRSRSPSLVIGDFRLSLSVSARLLGIPYASVSNAYWSDACPIPMPMPVLPLSEALPIPLARILFGIGKHLALPMHCAAMNQVRRRRGLPSLGWRLRTVYSDADHLLLVDIPGMYPLGPSARPHHDLGPVLWSPAVPLPEWWPRLPLDRPLIYVALGSSGRPATLRSVVHSVARLPVTVVASSAGTDVLDDIRLDNAFVAPYLPGDAVVALASVAVCNGGSMGCQQALGAGVPILGVAGNMDQFLNMQGVVAVGAGLCIRGDRIDDDSVASACKALGHQRYRDAAARVRTRMEGVDPVARLRDLLPSIARLPG